jgi:hypothetical protein
VEQEIKGRAEQDAKTEDDGMTAAERFRKARE